MWQRKEILRQRLALGRSVREVARGVGVAVGTVCDVVARAKASGLSWERIAELNENDIEVLLYRGSVGKGTRRNYPEPDWVYVYRELKKAGVTRFLLWAEYRERNPDGYSYSRYCELYQTWLGKLAVSMRQEHKAGEKMFVDFSGDRPWLQDPRNGEKVYCELFVAVLGASGLLYAEATRSQSINCWIEAHKNALEYFAGVPAITVPDNTKAAVIKPCLYEPQLNRAYRDWGEHYGTCIIPARPGRAKDKAKVENAVRLAQMWILARIRHRVFFTLHELNAAIRKIVDQLNNRPLQGLSISRRQLYETTDKLALRPLPQDRFETPEWKEVRVNNDYHVKFDDCFYSVPYNLIREKVDLRATATTVEIFFRGQRVASHKRLHEPRSSATIPEHMPKEHREYAAWTPSKIVEVAEQIGPSTHRFVQTMLGDGKRQASGYRRALGVVRLGKTYGEERLENACSKALGMKEFSYTSLKNMLESGFDKKCQKQEERAPLGDHENVRGQSYYA